MLADEQQMSPVCIATGPGRRHMCLSGSRSYPGAYRSYFEQYVGEGETERVKEEKNTNMEETKLP